MKRTGLLTRRLGHSGKWTLLGSGNPDAYPQIAEAYTVEDATVVPSNPTALCANKTEKLWRLWRL